MWGVENGRHRAQVKVCDVRDVADVHGVHGLRGQARER